MIFYFYDCIELYDSDSDGWRINMLVAYKIEHQEQYAVNGNMDKMNGKSSLGWTSVAQQSSLNFKLRLLPASIITKIEIKSKNAQIAVLSSMDRSQKQIEMKSLTFSNTKFTQVAHFKENTEVEYVHVTLENDLNNNFYLGLTYLIIFSGIKNDKSGKKELRVSSDDYADSLKLGRMKPANKSPHYIEIDKLKYDEKPKREKSLINVLKKSKDEYEQANYRKLTQKSNEVMIDLEEEKPRTYDIKDFTKYANTCSFVNEKWLKMQRQIEQQRGVKDSETLSRYLQVKHLYGRKFCLDNSLGNKRVILKKMCEQLGGQVLSDLAENMTLLTNRNDTQKVVKARKMGKVKVLKAEYLEACHKHQALLDEREYYVKW